MKLVDYFYKTIGLVGFVYYLKIKIILKYKYGFL